MDAKLTNIAAGHYQAWARTPKGGVVLAAVELAGLTDTFVLEPFGAGFDAGWRLGLLAQEADVTNMPALRALALKWLQNAKKEQADFGETERYQSLTDCAGELLGSHMLKMAAFGALAVPTQAATVAPVDTALHEDSTGQRIKAGDRVRFRGRKYTIERFVDGEGTAGTARILFVEPQHVAEDADETSVDKVEVTDVAGH